MKLAEYLIELASDDKCLERYDKDPERDIKRARLSQSATQALLSGDSRNVQKVLSEESFEMPFILVPGIKKGSLKVVAANGGNLLVKKLVVRRGPR